MKTILILTIIGLGFLGKAIIADDASTDQTNEKLGQYQKLDIKKSQTFHMSNEEATEANKQAVDNFQKQLEMSDPATKAAILKAQHELQEKNSKEQNSDSN